MILEDHPDILVLLLSPIILLTKIHSNACLKYIPTKTVNNTVFK